MWLVSMWPRAPPSVLCQGLGHVSSHPPATGLQLCPLCRWVNYKSKHSAHRPDTARHQLHEYLAAACVELGAVLCCSAAVCSGYLRWSLVPLQNEAINPRHTAATLQRCSTQHFILILPALQPGRCRTYSSDHPQSTSSFNIYIYLGFDPIAWNLPPLSAASAPLGSFLSHQVADVCTFGCGSLSWLEGLKSGPKRRD